METLLNLALRRRLKALGVELPAYASNVTLLHLLLTKLSIEFSHYESDGELLAKFVQSAGGDTPGGGDGGGDGLPPGDFYYAPGIVKIFRIGASNDTPGGPVSQPGGYNIYTVDLQGDPSLNPGQNATVEFNGFGFVIKLNRVTTIDNHNQFMFSGGKLIFSEASDLQFDQPVLYWPDGKEILREALPI